MFVHLLTHRACFPGLERDPVRPLQVCFEHTRLARGKARIIDVEVGLVVQAERAVVEVGRADGNQLAVHHQQHIGEYRQRLAALNDAGDDDALAFAY